METPTQVDSQSAGYGLRRDALSPLETLAQSVSTIAATTTPAATIPLVCALAGNGTWLAYVLATAAILLVALCISQFARYSASPGSLYTYSSMVLPPWLAAIAAWSLRSEEHTSELQSHLNLVCRLLLEKKKKNEILAISCIR